MKAPSSVFPLVLLAATVLGGCMSTRSQGWPDPNWIQQSPDLQFDFTLPVYANAHVLGIKVNVSFEGKAVFYLLRQDELPVPLKAMHLTDGEMEHLASLFEAANLKAYPEVVPTSGQVSVPARVVQLGYRADRGEPHLTVSGAVSRQRDVEAYPDGFFPLVDHLSDFIVSNVD